MEKGDAFENQFEKAARKAEEKNNLKFKKFFFENPMIITESLREQDIF